MGEIKVLMDPERREKYVSELFELEGWQSVTEDANAAYCPISLTSTPKKLKPYLKGRQEMLKNVLRRSGITSYDPSDSRAYSPDFDGDANPGDVYNFDSRKVAEARYFTGHLIIPTMGVGTEMEKARTLNKIAVALVDDGIRISRMLPSRVIYLKYSDFGEEMYRFVPVFDMLRRFEPGMGLNDGKPVLLGFERDSGRVVDLGEEVFEEFPELTFSYRKGTPLMELECTNMELIRGSLTARVLHPD
ncbi:MAG: hypothetical protein HYT73_00035 [Candidatus Aenigmarchaeota archaeon]|nr:hypothetical protein [Candidatus Aenigmarchaeota archaeon]